MGVNISSRWVVSSNNFQLSKMTESRAWQVEAMHRVDRRASSYLYNTGWLSTYRPAQLWWLPEREMRMQRDNQQIRWCVAEMRRTLRLSSWFRYSKVFGSRLIRSQRRLTGLSGKKSWHVLRFLRIGRWSGVNSFFYNSFPVYSIFNAKNDSKGETRIAVIRETGGVCQGNSNWHEKESMATALPAEIYNQLPKYDSDRGLWNIIVLSNSADKDVSWDVRSERKVKEECRAEIYEYDQRSPSVEAKSHTGVSWGFGKLSAGNLGTKCPE